MLALLGSLQWQQRQLSSAQRAVIAKAAQLQHQQRSNSPWLSTRKTPRLPSHHLQPRLSTGCEQRRAGQIQGPSKAPNPRLVLPYLLLLLLLHHIQHDSSYY